MKRLRRILLNFLCALSLLVCAATAALWIQSHASPHTWSVERYRAYEIRSCGGRLRLGVRTEEEAITTTQQPSTMPGDGLAFRSAVTEPTTVTTKTSYPISHHWSVVSRADDGDF